MTSTFLTPGVIRKHSGTIIVGELLPYMPLPSAYARGRGALNMKAGMRIILADSNGLKPMRIITK